MHYQFSSLLPPWVTRVCASKWWFSTLCEQYSREQNPLLKIIQIEDWDQNSRIDALFLDTTKNSKKQIFDFPKIAHLLNPNGLLILLKEGESDIRGWNRGAVGLSLEPVYKGSLKRFNRNLPQKNVLIFLRKFAKGKRVTVALSSNSQVEWQPRVRQWVRFFDEYHLYEQSELMLVFDGINPILPSWQSEENFWRQTNSLQSITHHQPFGENQCFMSAIQFSRAKYFLWDGDFSVPCYEMFTLLDKLFEKENDTPIYVVGKKVISDLSTGTTLAKAKPCSFLLLEERTKNKLRKLNFVKSSSVINYCNLKLSWGRSKKYSVFVNQGFS